MRGIRFSLRWLFGVVSFLAIGCGLLIYASPFLSKLTATLAVISLLTAVPAASYHTGDRRAFWAGFALFGFAYLWMVCGAWLSHDGSASLRDRLVTTDLLTRSYDALPSRQTALSGAAPPATAGWVTYNAGAIFDPYTGQATVPGSGSAYMLPPSVARPTDRADFLTTGHSLFAILFALLGGIITRRFSSRARAISAGTPSST
jgi:hypothetical protein